MCGMDLMLKIAIDDRSPRNILCLGAHCDDIEIGCGGTILKYVHEKYGLRKIYLCRL